MRKLLVIVVLMSACQEPAPKEKKAKEPRIDYYAHGKEITSIAQAELMKSVKSAIEEGGPAHAIKHCNVHATPLTDSLSKHFKCEINRVSIKSRNEDNAAKETYEKILLNNMLEASLEGGQLRDTLLAKSGKLLYYKPIFIGMETCLKCHGQIGQDIDSETISALMELYPEDKATNYRMGEFRGAWKVTFSIN